MSTVPPTSINNVLAEMIKKQNFLEKALLNTRVRKPIDYNRNYRSKLACPFEPGDIIMVEPADKFGIYEVRTDQVPSVIPPQKLHLTSSFSESIGALSANPGSITEELSSLNLNLGEIGIYKIYPIDFGYKLEINQPATITRFGNKTGSWNIAGADMVDLWDNHYQALVPEVMVFEDRTPITVKATSTDPNTANNYWVRVKIYGWSLPVRRLTDVSIQRNDPRIVASMWVGTPAK